MGKGYQATLPKAHLRAIFYLVLILRQFRVELGSKKNERIIASCCHIILVATSTKDLILSFTLSFIPKKLTKVSRQKE